MSHTGNCFFARLPRNVIALGLVSLCNDASSEIIYPLLPLFLTGTLGVGVQFVGLIEGVTESVASLLKLPAGWWSDHIAQRRGRKGLVVFGYTLASFIRPLLALTNAAWQVLGLRFLDRIGKGIRSAPRDALLADSVAPQQRGLAFGFHRAMDHAGAIVGALLSSWLLLTFDGDIRRVFWAAALPALIALAVLIVGVQEEREKEKRANREKENSEVVLPFVSSSPALSLSPSLPFSSAFTRYLAVLLLFTLGNSSDAFLLLRARDAGIGVAQIPLLWAALHVSKSVSSIIGGGLSDRLGRKALIVSGWLIYAAIYVAFAFVVTPTGIWLLFVIYGLYFGLTEGVEKAFIADLSPQEARGTAFGWYNLIIGIGALPASLLTGFLWQAYGAGTALLAGAGLSLAAALLLALVVNERRATNSA